MIELAYFAPSIEKLKWLPLRHLSLDNLRPSVLHEYFKRTPSVESMSWYEDHLAYLNPAQPFTRIYFGNEFCETLIPSVAEFLEAASMCREAEMRLTLVTPPVTVVGVHKIQKLIRAVQDEKMAIELVANDWGVLGLCVGVPAIRPVLGRVLAKQPQFPRIEGVPTTKKENGLTVKDWAFRHRLSQSPFIDKLTQKYHIQRLEFDLCRQGFLLSPNSANIPTSVYFPWVYLSSQRICPIGHTHRPHTEPIPANPQCEFQCRSYSEVMESNGGGVHQLLFQKGNTVFELVKPEVEVFNQLAATVNLDRIVYQSTLPF